MTIRSVLTCGLGLAAILALAAPVAAEPALPPFYAAVSQMKPEGRLGHVVAMQRVATPVRGAIAWRIAYISSDMANNKTISTGLVVAPRGKAPKGGRPVMSWAHGTTGTAQSCGPSQVFNPVVPLNEYFLPSGNSYMDYGVPALEAFIKAGYVVVASDFQGLGGGGRHQYQIAVTQARDSINAIRAAAAIKQTGAGRTAVVYGWSQGAGAALAAASDRAYLEQTGTAYDGIKLVGAVAMAPPDFHTLAPAAPLDEANAAGLLNGIVKSFSNNVNNFNHFLMTMWAAQAAFPDRLKLTDVFTEPGAKFVDEVMGNKCVHAAADTISYSYGNQYTSLLRPDPVSAKAWAETLINSAGTADKPMVPIIIFWGTKDTVVPPAMHKAYRERMCKMGANVTRVQLAGELTHFATPGASEPLYLPWIADRLAGKPAPDGCGAEQVQN